MPDRQRTAPTAALEGARSLRRLAAHPVGRSSQARSEAGLVFDGLRESAAVAMAEAGCKDTEVAAITGHTRQTVEHYAKGAERRRLAVAVEAYAST